MDTQQQLPTPPSQVLLFVDRLIDQRNFPNLTPAIREELKTEALERLNDFLVGATIDALSDEDVEIFNKMVEEEKSSDEIQKFAANHIPDFPKFFSDTLQRFQDLYLE